MAEEEAEAVEAADPPKKSKLPMIITLVAGLVLGGGGAAGYFLFLAPEPEASDQHLAAAELAKKALAKRKPVFVEVDRVSAPLIAEGKHVVGHVSLYLRLQVKNSDDQDWVRDRVPMIRHAINLVITQSGVNFADDAFKVDYDGAAAKITGAINDYLQTDKVLASHIIEAVRL